MAPDRSRRIGPTRALYDIAETLSAAGDPERRLAHALDLLRALVPHDGCAVLEGRKGRSRTIVAPSDCEERPRLEEACHRLLQWIGSSGAGSAPPPAEIVKGAAPWRHYLAVPLVSLDDLFGVLLITRREDEPFIEEDVSHLSIVASQIAGYLSALHRHHEESRHGREMGRALFREQEARADAESANLAKDEFISIVSHELRTPITAILGWSKLVQGRVVEDGDAIARGIDSITRNAESLARLVDDLLDVSRMARGTFDLARRVVPPGDEVAAAVDASRPAAAARGIELRAESDGTAGNVFADPDRLRQIIGNLVANGLKFTPPGGSVTVRVRGEGDDVVIDVIDTGEGIHPDFLPYIFDPFRQAEAGSTRAHGGLGLGLAIVRHLAELHGGSVEAHSEGPGRGARFSVRLPSHRTETIDAGEVAAPLGQAAASLRDARVLVVDDVQDAREMLSHTLRRYGARVHAVSSALEAIAVFEKEHPDLLLADIGMPDINGYELIRRIRSLEHGSGRRLPAAALTAFASDDDRRRALAAGYEMHLAKPIVPETLVRALSRLLHDSRQA